MEKKMKILTPAIVAICLSATAALAKMPTTAGTISKVTVYRGQALVTRTVDIGLPRGTSELIVKGLPGKIVPESLYAQTSDNITVLSVRYREKAVKEDTREEVKQLDNQIEEVAKQLRHAEGDLKHLHNQWGNMFSKLREFTVNATKSDLNRGLLTFEPIKKLTTFIEEKGLEYHKRATELRDRIDILKKELEVLNRKRKKLDAGRSRTEREAVLFVRKDGKKETFIELSYLVNGADWLPQYNLRANLDKSDVLIEYNAVVNQTSGEDWDGIALSVSTAEPAMVAAAPVLGPMLITLGRGIPGEQEDADQQMRRSINSPEQFKELRRSRRLQAKKGKAAQVELGQIAASNQVLEFNISRKDLDRIKEEVSEIARVEGVSVTYKLPGRLTLPSRTDQQLVTIASITTKADFTLVATPLLTDYVYLQGELLNDSDTILLSGPASMFRNGEFVGTSRLPVVTIGEKFTAGFGIDSRVQVVRELEDKKTRHQGGNRIDTYYYRIALSNYKNIPAELQLLDRLPYTDNNAIKIELDKTGPELSKDSQYLRSARKKGILRWDLKLPPNSVDQDATVVKYSFTMEYDKNMHIQPLPGQ